MSNIAAIHAREVLDSRGNPTIEAKCFLRTARWGGRLCPAVHPLASTRQWSCATRIRTDSRAKACSRRFEIVNGEIAEALATGMGSISAGSTAR